MRASSSTIVLWVCAGLTASSASGQEPSPTAKKPEPKAMVVSVESSLTTLDDHIRQFAFDADDATFFASETNAAAEDHFTFRFDEPVALNAMRVTTGRPGGEAALTGAIVEASEDGENFQPIEAKCANGVVTAAANGRKLRAIRLRPAAAIEHALVIRETQFDSDPPAAVFKYPIEFEIDVTDAPQMKQWAEKVARICERAYPMINEELPGEGFKPRHQVLMRLSANYRGVAAAGGGRITGSVKYFTDHPDDVGAMVHETAHIVQNYRGRGNPGWLVEGVADYVRFFKFEPGKIGRINPDRAKYDASYRTTAAFLAYVTDKYDKDLVKKLNDAMRRGRYREEMFKELTGKPVQELGEEWLASMRPKPAPAPEAEAGK